MKRTVEENTLSSKRCKVEVPHEIIELPCELTKLPDEIIELVLPWIPRASEVCKLWDQLLHNETCNKLRRAMEYWMCSGFEEMKYTTKENYNHGLRKGVSFALHLQRRGVFVQIPETLKRLWCYEAPFPLETVQYNIPFYYGLKLKEEFRGPSIWMFVDPNPEQTWQRTYHVSQLILEAKRTFMPHRLMLDTLERAIASDACGDPSSLPFCLTCCGIQVESETKPIFGLEWVTLSDLHPTFLKSSEKRFPGIIEYVCKYASCKHFCWETAKWLFEQNISSKAVKNLLRAALQTEEHDQIKKYFGETLEHIPVTAEIALKLIRYDCTGDTHLVECILRQSPVDLFTNHLEMLKCTFNSHLIRRILQSTNAPEELMLQCLLDQNNPYEMYKYFKHADKETLWKVSTEPLKHFASKLSYPGRKTFKKWLNK